MAAGIFTKLPQNPFFDRTDPTTELLAKMKAPQSSLPMTYEDTIPLICDHDPNASGFLRGPVITVFSGYPPELWEKVSARYKKLTLDEFRSLRFYTENYFNELNGALRSGFPFELKEGDDRSWTFTRLFWWMHQGIRTLSAAQPKLDTVYRWHKPGRWVHWRTGDIYTTSAFMSTAGPTPNQGGTQYAKHFGELLLKLDIRQLPKEYYADVSELSKFQAEGEVLLVPWLRFAVQSVRDLSEEEARRWQAKQEISLEYVGLCSDG